MEWYEWVIQIVLLYGLWAVSGGFAYRAILPKFESEDGRAHNGFSFLSLFLFAMAIAIWEFWR